MSARPCVSFLKALALSAALGCGASAPAVNTPDGAAPDGSSSDVALPDAASTDVASTDVASTDQSSSDVASPDAATSDGAPLDGTVPDSAVSEVGETICNGDRWGQSAAELEAIAGCTVIDGNLSVTGNDLLIAELPRLTRVNGFLTVWGSPKLARASFPMLERIGGYLDVSFNAALATLELPALESVNERALVVANDVQIRDNALPACQTDAIRDRLAAHGVRDKVSIVADGAVCPPP